MKILLTGAFGNVGESTLIELKRKNYEVICFDIPSKRNVKIQKKLAKKYHFKTVWGDIRSVSDLDELFSETIAVIIHLAAIIPPLADEQPQLAYEVNVKGTQNLLNHAIKQQVKPKFVMASSIAIYGSKMTSSPPRTVLETPAPLSHDEYAKQKVTMEQELINSGLNWLILRLSAVPPFEISWKIPKIMFDVPLAQRFEFVHTRDVGYAFAQTVETPIEKRIFLIGGGENCQMYQKDFLKSMLHSLGIGMLPEYAFHVPKDDNDWFHTDWMDTKDAQEILKFQRLTFEDFIKEYSKRMRLRRYICILFRPIVRKILLDSSPYLKLQKKKKISPSQIVLSS